MLLFFVFPKHTSNEIFKHTHTTQLADSSSPLQHNWIVWIFTSFIKKPEFMGADRSQNRASELKLQMDLSATSNTGFYRDPSNSCGWGLCTFTLLLAKPHGHWVSGREITPALKMSPCSDPCVTSEAKQSSQTACLIHGPSSRICSTACCSLSTVVIFGFAPTRGGNETFWCCHVCPIVFHSPVTELDWSRGSLPTPPRRCPKTYPKIQDEG